VLGGGGGLLWWRTNWSSFFLTNDLLQIIIFFPCNFWVRLVIQYIFLYLLFNKVHQTKKGFDYGGLCLIVLNLLTHAKSFN